MFSSFTHDDDDNGEEEEEEEKIYEKLYNIIYV